MNNRLVLFLDKLLGPHKEYNGFELYYKCPLCNRADDKKKLAIKLDENAKKDGNSIYLNWHCWRDPSHKGKNLFQLLKRMKVDDTVFTELKSILENKVNLKDFDNNIKTLLNTEDKIYTKIKGLPKEFISFKDAKDTLHYRNAYRYITKERGISEEDIIKYNIGYCETGKYAGYIIVPSYDENMNINYFVARSFYKNAIKYKNPPFKKDIVFNEIFINWKKPIILCEGVFDMMAIKRNAIPLLGKYIQPYLKLKILQHGIDIYIALDKDAINDSLNIIQEFLKNGINVYFVELTEKDPSLLGFNKMWELIKSAKKIDFKDLIEMRINTI